MNKQLLLQLTYDIESGNSFKIKDLSDTQLKRICKITRKKLNGLRSINDKFI